MAGVCRSCGAAILWALTESRRKIPLDAEPTSNGNMRLIGTLAVHIRDDEPADGAPRYTAHFATCPESVVWRKQPPERKL